MKNIFILIMFILPFSTLANENTTPRVEHTNAASIDDGWYEATVKYHNFSTYEKATYTLNVKVKYGKIVAIDFGNGGSVHSGYNDSGYYWSGGYLSESRDWNTGVVTSASATVNVNYDNGTMTKFYILIN